MKGLHLPHREDICANILEIWGIVMAKVGRNEPCPCGSGKKYKYCCLDKDEHSISAVDEYDSFGDISLNIKANSVWYSVVEKVREGMASEYDYHVMQDAVELWDEFVQAESPIVRKPEVFAAALEYVSALGCGLSVTQKEVAEKYQVSVSAVSQRSTQLIEFDLQQLALEELEAENQTPYPMLQSERYLRNLEGVLSQQQFESEEELNRFLKEIDLDTIVPVVTKREQAQNLLFDALEHHDPEIRISLAEKALKIYPDSPDAYVVFANAKARNLEETLKYYKLGVEAGERDLGQDFFDEHKGHFWGIVKTRPYMRAKQGYALALHMSGKLREAIKHFEELLELNPMDNQGVRYSLLPLYIKIKDYMKIERLFKEYDEASATFLYDRVLIEYSKNGITKKLSTLIKEAREHNPYVLDYLLFNKEMPDEMPMYVGVGDESEAVEYILEHFELWFQEPELIDWLRKTVS